MTAALLLALQIATQPPCTTPDPGAGFVCHAGQWLPPGHPLLPQGDPDGPSEADCIPWPDPYREPDRATRCALWKLAEADKRRAHDPPPTFEPGATYAHIYPSIKMRVLAVAPSVAGVPVVLCQFVAGPELGAVFAFKVTTAAQAKVWTRIEP